jgi:TnpA family transposase
MPDGAARTVPARRCPDLLGGSTQIICYGNGGDIPSNHHGEQELTVLCLRLLQTAMIYVNTLMIQRVGREARTVRLASRRT